MTLLVDIGNSRIKWASVRRHKRTDLQSAARPTNAPFAAFADEHWAAIKAPKKFLIANVAGADLAEAADAWMQARGRRRPGGGAAGRGARGGADGGGGG